MAASCYIAVFDVTEDRERARVAKVLEGYGVRVQKSVFECRLNRSGLRRLEQELTGIGLSSGGCIVYRVGAQFQRTQIGLENESVKGSDDHVFVA